MYPNIPTNELIPIIRDMTLANQLDQEITNELIQVTHTVLEQNYFTFNNRSHSQLTGLAMGAPSSAILSAIYLQYLEHTKIIKTLTQHGVIGYFRYVNDILIVYDENSTDIQELHRSFNNLAPTIKFALETETNGGINFLDISIQNASYMLAFNIHWKPTATDVIIPKDSCHPPEQKHAAIRNMINRMNSYKLNDASKQHEQQIIEQIIADNGYDISIIKLFHKTKHKDNTNDNRNSWAKFTYFGRETRVITKLFKETHLGISYKVNNTINK
jgi:hypothetical protein